MLIKDIQFIGSYPGINKCPVHTVPEYAFIGRSNVGKSSLINMLVDRKNLARTSSTPGKTQLINLFCINKSWNICDLPGYGYARISKTQRVKWQKMIRAYLNRRQNLVLAFVLIDGNIPTQDIDIEFINKLGEEGIPFHLIFTKMDKKGAIRNGGHMEQFNERLSEKWDEIPRTFVTSSTSNMGKEDLLRYIEELNQEILNHKE